MKLLINGDFEKEDLQEIEKELSRYQVKTGRFITAGIDMAEIVRLFFEFAVESAGSGIIGNAFYDVLKVVIKWVKNKKPKAEIQVTIGLDFGNEKPNIRIAVPIDNVELFKIQIEKTLTVEFIGSLKKGEAIQLTWDENNNGIKIFRM